ncbi:cytochrome P450 [Apiospora hydei]|uniref:Cytochrome P450 n=1 Tax=Apiospora hydei TaxID=1337664 RepID=A0ABR1WAG1_9PEZI
MEYSAHIWPLVVVVFSFWLVSTAVSWWRLRHVPGPFFASVSWLWTPYKIFRGGGVDHSYLRKYGSVVLIDDPQAFRQLNGARSLAHRDTWYSMSKLDPEQDTTFSSLEIGPHDRLKAKAAPGYSGRDGGVDFEDAVDRTIKYLIDAIRHRHLSSSKEGDDDDDLVEVDFAHLIRFFNIDLITDVGYGQRFGFLDGKDDEYRYTHGIEQFETDVSPDSIAREIIRGRFADDAKDRGDMIGAFMRSGMSQKETLAESFVQILAGSDTTAVVIRTTMLHIITAPRVYQRLKQDIKAAGLDDSSPISNEQAKSLSYFQAVMWEGFRMGPPLLYGLFKVLPPGGATLCGVPLPGGTSVGANNVAMMRRTDIFGRDAHLFRPERFLECDEETRKERVRTVELLFGFGRWQCAGKNLAMIELNKIYFELLRAFDFQIVNPGKAWEVKPSTVSIQSKMWVKITDASDE